MRKFIFLDTNNWIYLSNGFNILSNKHDELHLKIFDTIKKRVNDGSLVFLINDIVIDEWNRNKSEAENQIIAIQNKYKAYLNSLNVIQEFISCNRKRITKLKKVLEEKYNEKIQRHRDHIKSVEEFLLKETVKIDISDKNKIEASNLALAKKAPFIGDKKNSMADALILLSSIEYIYENEKIDISLFSEIKEKQLYFPESYFMSTNEDEFSSFDDKEIIHPDLESYQQNISSKLNFPESYFVSSNKGDFSSPEDKEIIHPDLESYLQKTNTKGRF